ncbi:hypothetical protein AAVH_37326, partial [Aphelenchoides avenae]
THAVLQEILLKYIVAFDEGDIRKFVTEFYHPHCTMVHRNVKCYYGHEGVIDFHEPWMGPNAPKMPFETRNEWWAATADGQYIVCKSVYFDPAKPDVTHPVEHVFKREEDGRYVIYHEDFEMPLAALPNGVI